MSDIDVKQFTLWVKNIISAFPEMADEIRCRECGGDGSAECPCCGADTGECDECGGAGWIRVVDLLTTDFYEQCMRWEMGHEVAWANGEPVRTARGLYQRGDGPHPLNALLNEIAGGGYESHPPLIAFFQTKGADDVEV